jgi:hypothetical protein
VIFVTALYGNVRYCQTNYRRLHEDIMMPLSLNELLVLEACIVADYRSMKGLMAHFKCKIELGYETDRVEAWTKRMEGNVLKMRRELNIDKHVQSRISDIYKPCPIFEEN